MASAIVRSNKDLSEITSLKVLVTDSNLRSGLKAYEEHLGSLHCASIHNMVGSLISLADNFLGSDAATLKILRDLRQRVYTRKRGMTDKNIDRLRQFVSRDNVRAFITVGDKLIAQSKKCRHLHKRSLMIQTALMHEIMLIAPIRAKNLTELNLEHNFRQAGKGNNRSVLLVLSAEETKNDREMEFQFPLHLIQLFDTYLKDYRPRLLTGIDRGWLFPGIKQGHKNQVTVGDQLVKAVGRTTGIRINPHLYRHIAALLFLQEYPEGYETVRLLLGHKSVDTTIMFYAGFSDTNARRHYADLVTSRRFQITEEDG